MEQVQLFSGRGVFKRRKTKLLVGLAVLVGLAAVSAVSAFATGWLGYDSFNGPKVDIVDHAPGTDPTGGGWSVELGDWEVHNGEVREKSHVQEEESSDYRALLDAGVSDVRVRVSLQIKPGNQLWGTVVRHSGDRDWIMAFHDGVGDFILGKKRPDEDRFGTTVGSSHPEAGGFQELGRIAMNWPNNSTHMISLEVDGSAITAYADGDPVLTATDDDSMTSHIVGIFSRGKGGNRLEDFIIAHAE